MKIIFSCGGTGGHINPALAVAKVVRAKRPESKILFVGGEYGMESRLVPREGFDFVPLKVHSFKRSITPAALWRNVRAAVSYGGLLKKSEQIIRDFEPDVVMGTGGYASFPIVWKASGMGIPSVIHESNAMPGLATKMLAGRVDRIMVSFEDTGNYYRRNADRLRVTGTPVREEFVFLCPDQVRAELGLGDKPLVVSYFGSQGAREMNKIIADYLTLFKADGAPFTHVHSAGSYGYRWLPDLLRSKGVDPENQPGLDLREYIYDMPQLMIAADIVICRAGASTLSELAAAAAPAIIVPSPNVAGNHQEKNARAMEARGAAKVALESQLSGEKLYKEVKDLLADAEQRGKIKAALRDMAFLDAADRIYNIIVQLLAEKGA